MPKTVSVNTANTNRWFTILGLYDVEVRVIGTNISFILGAGSLGALQTVREVSNNADVTGTALTVGRYCDFNTTCRILVGGEHRHPNSLSFSGSPLIKSLARNSELSFVSYSKGPITIGGGCVFGLNSILLSGVTLGDYVLVGAGAAVSTQIPVCDYSILAGNPARLIAKSSKNRYVNELHKLDPVQVFEAFRVNPASPDFSDVGRQPLGERLVVIDMKFIGNKINSMSIAGLRHNKEFKQLVSLSTGVREFFQQINDKTDNVDVDLDIFRDFIR